MIARDDDRLRDAIVDVLTRGMAQSSEEALKFLGREDPRLFEPVRITDPDDARCVVMEAVPFSERSRKRWFEVCARQAEWTESRTAQGKLPPCHAHHTRPGIQDCPEDVRIACAEGVLTLTTGMKAGGLMGRLSALSKRWKMPAAGSYREPPPERNLYEPGE